MVLHYIIHYWYKCYHYYYYHISLVAQYLQEKFRSRAPAAMRYRGAGIS